MSAISMPRTIYSYNTLIFKGFLEKTEFNGNKDL
jgi:hypothetical protein